MMDAKVRLVSLAIWASAAEGITGSRLKAAAVMVFSFLCKVRALFEIYETNEIKETKFRLHQIKLTKDENLGISLLYMVNSIKRKRGRTFKAA
jgi:hypothetical protein